MCMANQTATNNEWARTALKSCSNGYIMLARQVYPLDSNLDTLGHIDRMTSSKRKIMKFADRIQTLTGV